MITEDYVSFETANLLKEKRFDEICRAFWKEWNGEISLCSCNSSHTFEYCYNTMLENYNDSEETNIAAPTLQMAMKWLREIYDLHIIAYPWRANKEERATHWCCKVYKSFNLLGYEKYTNETPKSYEEACGAAIKYCLENLI